MKEFTWDAIPDTRLLGAKVTDTLSCIYVHPHQHRLMSKRCLSGMLSVFIHYVIVFQVIPTCNIVQPFLIFKIPSYGLFHALHKLETWLVQELTKKSDAQPSPSGFTSQPVAIQDQS